MGIWPSRQTSSLRGNRFCRCPERSHCCDLYVFRQPTLSWTVPTIHESRTFVGAPDLYVSWSNIAIAKIYLGVLSVNTCLQQLLPPEHHQSLYWLHRCAF